MEAASKNGGESIDDAAPMSVHEDHRPVAPDSAGGDLPACQYCSFAVTGKHPAFQSIYVCYTCSEGSSFLQCVCQACADACHADHDGLEYVGMGPSYCDCHAMTTTTVDGDVKPVCQIGTASDDEAKRLNLAVHGGLSDQESPVANAPGSYRMGVYAIPELDDEVVSRYLVTAARELVRHSKETFWIDPADDTSTYCCLEKLALAVYRTHASNNDRCCGGEWWVQVKPLGTKSNSDEAVDMHYDKDERVAEAFGLGCFPILSTVTYLTGRGIESKPSLDLQPQAPTLVLTRKYDDNDASDDNATVDLLLSHPRRGKHLVFDGRLLHGAPAHPALRESPMKKLTEIDSDLEGIVGHRVTFLVNVWSGHRPAGVSHLPNIIREKLKGLKPSQPHPSSIDDKLLHLDFQSLPLPQRVVVSADMLLGKPLHLPFVGKNATWGVEEDDGDELVVSVHVPPKIGCPGDDTVLLRFQDASIRPCLLSLSSDDD